MAFLAIDTATSSLALALGDGAGRILASWTSRLPKMHATLLNPLLEEMLGVTGLAIGDIEGIAAGMGPGSYTGVRIGVTAAKTIGMVRRIPIAPVSSLAAAAYGARGHTGLIAVLWDARRGEAYCATFRSTPESFTAIGTEARMPYERFVDEIGQVVGDEPTSIALLGDGAHEAYALLAVRQPQIPCHIYDPQSAVFGHHVLQLGYPALLQMAAREEHEHVEGAHALAPRYLQLAEAEARWRLKEWGSLSDGS